MAAISRRVVLFGLVLCTAAADGQTMRKGRLLLADDFKTPAVYTKEFQPVSDGWRVRAWHGEWVRSAEGIESHWSSGHMPVLAYEGSFDDVIIELEFRYRKVEGQKALCRISATNPELNPRAYSVSSWANENSKERELGVVLEHDEWKPGIITTAGRKPAEFQPETWHRMRLEVWGNQASVTVDGVTVSGSHEKFGLHKTLIAIGTGYSPHEIRKLRVYEATAAGSAEDRRKHEPAVERERAKRPAPEAAASTGAR